MHLQSEWKFRAEVSPEVINSRVSELQAQTGLSELTLRVCVLRGLETPEAIREYLAPNLATLKNPFTLRDMDRAVARLARARIQGERIRVYGDYDVDGTTAAALLTWVFREFGQFQFDAVQPDRFKDGYGLNVRAVEQAHADGAKVLLTVDCGITSFDAAQKAKDLGLDLIVVDHHQLDPSRGLPVAHAVVNPQRADCESGLRQLCGCGLAFYLAMALRSRGRDEGWFEGVPPNLKQHLDLVVIATAADMVPLIGDNRTLVRHGLEVLRNSNKPGVRALLAVSGLSGRDVGPGHLGFALGPRINASGRMQSASLALEMLSTTDAGRGMQLAQELERLNTERAALQNQIWDQVRKRVEQGIASGRFRHGIVVADPGWHEGVVGIVASRVTETFKRPAAVVALREDIGKGSVRSFGGKDVLSALRLCAEHLAGFGGHKCAAGLTVSHEKVDALALAFDAALERLNEENHSAGPSLLIEGECRISELDLRTLEELENLAPFGPGNPEPVFTAKAVVRDHRVLKERHLKMNLSSATPGLGKSQAPSVVEAIWFHAAERLELFEGDILRSEAEWAFVPELNRFRGRATPSLRIRDRRLPAGE